MLTGVYTWEDSVWRPTSQETSYSDNDTTERRGHHVSRSISSESRPQHSDQATDNNILTTSRNRTSEYII